MAWIIGRRDNSTCHADVALAGIGTAHAGAMEHEGYPSGEQPSVHDGPLEARSAARGGEHMRNPIQFQLVQLANYYY